MEARVRPARESDREPLMSFIKDVWGGHDYIPNVWDEWLRDRRGKMFVVEVDGVPVGMNRVSFPQDGSAWFQGARIHPEYRGKGLATMLGENSMKFAAERGLRVFRLTTGSRNYASRRQTARMQFSELARFSVYEPPKKRGKADRIQRVTGAEAKEAMRLVRRSSEFQLGAGMYWHDFAVASLTPKVFAGLVDRGAVYRLGGAVAVVDVGGEGFETWEEIGFICGPVADSAKLVKSALGRVKGADARWAFIPQRSRLIASLRRAGFTRSFSQIVYERKAANG